MSSYDPISSSDIEQAPDSRYRHPSTQASSSSPSSPSSSSSPSSTSSRSSTFIVSVFLVFGVACLIIGTLIGAVLNGSYQVGDPLLVSHPETQSVSDRLSLHHHDDGNGDDGDDDDDTANIPEDGGSSVCDDPNYSKTSLKTARENSVIALFHDTKNQKKFEASDIIRVKDHFYVVFDNIFAIGKLKDTLPFYSTENMLLGDVGIDSGYEAIVHDPVSDTFYVFIESLKSQKSDTYHSVVQHLKLRNNNNDEYFDRRSSCPCSFVFHQGNKGFEGASGLVLNGEFHLLALCEGNYCLGGKEGKESGNGRLVLMRYRKLERPSDFSVALPDTQQHEYDCVWETLQVINLPTEAFFQDYSALALRPIQNSNHTYRIAVSSQESSSVMIANLDVSDFSFSKIKILRFPRDSNCNIHYCNIEGVEWLNDQMLVAVSDKMKGKGKQKFQCADKDQSVHIFVLP